MNTITEVINIGYTFQEEFQKRLLPGMQMTPAVGIGRGVPATASCLRYTATLYSIRSGFSRFGYRSLFHREHTIQDI